MSEVFSCVLRIFIVSLWQLRVFSMRENYPFIIFKHGMSDQKKIRLSKVAQELNVGLNKITEVLKKKGYDEKFTANTEITQEQYSILEKEFSASKAIKKEASSLHIGGNHGTFVIDTSTTKKTSSEEEEDFFVKKEANPSSGESKTKDHTGSS
ncbi:MAG: hypothetical protein NZ521_08565, partial [Flammeovirgaceae bacterium]|nr:hypothetical protein [Flammeovirgaceae bacterium]